LFFRELEQGRIHATGNHLDGNVGQARPLPDDLLSFVGEADRIVGVAEEVLLLAFEKGKDASEQWIAQVPQAAFYAFVGPEAPHVEDELQTVPLLEAQPEQGRQVSSGSGRWRNGDSVQPQAQPVHVAQVPQRGKHRRLFGVQHGLPSNATVPDNVRDLVAPPGEVFRFLGADHRKGVTFGA
jgi:hypothetical protein